MDFNTFYESGQYNLWNTDKGTNHSYIEHYYNNEFTNKRLEKINLLEIGVWRGDSIKLFRKWFEHGNIYGIDDNSGIFGNTADKKDIETNDTKLIWDDAYSHKVVEMFNNMYFDYIIDDGPHTLESHEFFIKNWLPKLKISGKAIIEDIHYISHEHPLSGQQLINLIDTSKYEFNFYDFRNHKNRGDDIILEIVRIV